MTLLRQGFGGLRFRWSLEGLVSSWWPQELPRLGRE